ncbi:hypothetical protein BDR07DRAFT_1385102 [Suillus spraguei]|nr:hypothetical protein BDR07DRAFT_1385102 [Suillus spraguei]
MMVVDNCCQVWKAVTAAMPETGSKLDVWHFGARYIAAMLHSSKSPYQATVAGDIMGAILKSRANGSQIEGSHKGWNSLQHAQPSDIIMLSALGHNFVLCHNLLVLPELDVVESGETFGLVMSDHITTFRGLLVKKEDIEDEPLGTFDSTTDLVTGEEVDLALQASRNIFINESQIDPALLEHPAGASKTLSSRLLVASTMAMPLSPMKQKVTSFDSDDQDDGNSMAKKLRLICQDNVLQLVSLSNSPPSTAGKLDEYFSSVSDFPPSTSTSINNSTGITSAGTTSAGINNSIGITSTSIGTTSTGINNSIGITSASINNSITASTRTTSTSINNSITPSARISSAGQTPSQRLFSIATGIDPHSLTIKDSDEFYLFMDMWAEFKWLSYQMTSRRWVLATEEYNLHLMKKKGESVVRKNPQALLHALGNIKPKLMNKIIKDDYTSKKTTSLFGASIALLCRL